MKIEVRNRRNTWQKRQKRRRKSRLKSHCGTLYNAAESTQGKYHHTIVTAAEVVEERLQFSKDIQHMNKAPQEMGLLNVEYALYTAIANKRQRS